MSKILIQFLFQILISDWKLLFLLLSLRLNLLLPSSAKEGFSSFNIAGQIWAFDIICLNLMLSLLKIELQIERKYWHLEESNIYFNFPANQKEDNMNNQFFKIIGKCWWTILGLFSDFYVENLLYKPPPNPSFEIIAIFISSVGLLVFLNLGPGRFAC